MIIKQEKINVQGIKFIATGKEKEIGRAYLYILNNDLHDVPFGFIEDVNVQEKYRGQGVGTELVKKIIIEAKKQKCYKIIMTSRYSRDKVHKLYKKLGFDDWGKEFKMVLRSYN